MHNDSKALRKGILFSHPDLFAAVDWVSSAASVVVLVSLRKGITASDIPALTFAMGDSIYSADAAGTGVDVVLDEDTDGMAVHLHLPPVQQGGQFWDGVVCVEPADMQRMKKRARQCRGLVPSTRLRCKNRTLRVDKQLCYRHLEQDYAYDSD